MIDIKKVNEVFNHIAPHSADYDYFFDSINSPKWIDPLFQKGCFKDPPPPIRSEDYVRFPIWAESKYLARMAKEAKDVALQARIVNIALGFAETENVRVQEDLADIALSVSPQCAKKLLPKIKVFFDSPYQLLLPDKFGSLIKKFAEANEAEDAFQLAELAFKIIPSQKRDGKKEEVRRPLDKYHYGANLTRVLSSLCELDSERAFFLFFGLLKNSLNSKYAIDKPYSDYSYMWRPSIEASKYNRYEHGIKFHLVDAVRASAEMLLKIHPEKTAEIVATLESGKWTALDRIALHIMRIYPDTTTELIKKKIIGISLYDDLNYQYEYCLLAKEHGGKLSEDERRGIFELILVGPDLEKWKERAKAFGHTIPPDEELDRGRKMWIRDRLTIFKDYLDPKTSEIYQKLLSDVGYPNEDWGLPVQHEGVWVGPTTPKSVDELKSMTVEELVNFLKKWESPGGWRDATPEGLSRTLTEAFKADISKYVGKLCLFREVDPTYIKGAIRGIIETNIPLNEKLWEEILSLFSWVLEQPIEILGRDKGSFDQDSSWRPIRNEICRLLKIGFEKGSKELPFALRERVFKVLLPLTDDPHPSIEDEKEFARRPYDLAINSTRGVALEALISYALWVKQNLLNNKELKPANVGFKEIPEAQKVLDAHLDTGKEPTLAIRSVYGAYLQNLLYLDSQWVKDKINVIFPIANREDLPYFDASWTSLMLFGSFHISFYSLLEKQYSFFAKRIFDEDYVSWHEKEMLEEHYCDHLMIFHLNGLIPIADASLLGEILENASPLVRSHIMRTVGRWVSSEKEMPKELYDRYIAFWERRLAKAKGEKDISKFNKELENFGWWVGSKHLPARWTIEQILEVLKLIGKIEPGHQVAEFMEAHCEEDMLNTLECIQLVFKGDKEGWGFYSWVEPATKIIKSALQNKDPEVRTKADVLRNWLIAKGYRQFRS